jgi:hypothetical protein
MTRLKALQQIRNHTLLGSRFARLTQAEVSLMRQFIRINDGLDCLAFEDKVNRMFLDKPKPKNWTIIQEVLCNANSIVGALARAGREQRNTQTPPQEE